MYFQCWEKFFKFSIQDEIISSYSYSFDLIYRVTVTLLLVSHLMLNKYVYIWSLVPVALLTIWYLVYRLYYYYLIIPLMEEADGGRAQELISLWQALF